MSTRNSRAFLALLSAERRSACLLPPQAAAGYGPPQTLLDLPSPSPDDQGCDPGPRGDLQSFSYSPRSRTAVLVVSRGYGSPEGCRGEIEIPPHPSGPSAARFP